jgi:hypothetical protein
VDTFPIDTADMTFTAVEVVEVLDDRGRQAEDKDGVPKWRVRVLAQGSALRKPEVIEVGIVSRAEPAVPTMSPVTFTRLRARAWAQGDRHGISLSADSVNRVTAPNGKVPPAPVPAS